MGYIKHHAIVVTSWDEKLIQRAHTRAEEIGCAVSPVLPSGLNGYRSFLIAPDGSKEGWDDSELGDARRNMFVRWADEQRYDDGSTSLHWVEVSYSSDDAEAAITRHAWAKPSLLEEIAEPTR